MHTSLILPTAQNMPVALQLEKPIAAAVAKYPNIESMGMMMPMRDVKTRGSRQSRY